MRFRNVSKYSDSSLGEPCALVDADEAGVGLCSELRNMPPAVQPASSEANNRAVCLTIDDRQYALVARATQRKAHLKVRARFAVLQQLHGTAMRLHALGDDG